jgi:plasmid maintenance system antidote protein VapI
MRTVLQFSPGEMLEKEFLKLLGFSKYHLAHFCLRSKSAAIRSPR